MTLGELFEETYIQGEIAIRSYDSTGTTIEHYLGDAEEFYPDEHPQILEREVGYIFPLMEVEPTICIELKNEEDDVSSFTLNPSWLSCEDETQRCIMVEIYLEP